MIHSFSIAECHILNLVHIHVMLLNLVKYCVCYFMLLKNKFDLIWSQWNVLGWSGLERPVSPPSAPLRCAHMLIWTGYLLLISNVTGAMVLWCVVWKEWYVSVKERAPIFSHVSLYVSFCANSFICILAQWRAVRDCVVVKLFLS